MCDNEYSSFFVKFYDMPYLYWGSLISAGEEPLSRKSLKSYVKRGMKRMEIYPR
jgi:hypothetical protein